MKNYFLQIAAFLFLFLSLHSFAAVTFNGAVSSINDPSGILASDLGFDNFQVGTSYSASFNFGSPTIYASYTSQNYPDFQVYAIDDPSYSASISFTGQPTINSVAAQDHSNIYVGLAQDYLTDAGGYFDVYLLDAEVTDNIWMRFVLGDSTGTALNSNSFYAEHSLDDWDLHEVYLLHIEFNPNYKELGNLVITNPVPIPAAAWLFGSALVGLAGVKRRKIHK